MESEIQGESHLQDHDGQLDSQHHEEGHFDSPEHQEHGNSEMYRYADEEEDYEHAGEYGHPDMEGGEYQHHDEDGYGHHEYDQSGHHEGYEDGQHESGHREGEDEHENEDHEEHEHEEDASQSRHHADESFSGQVIANQLRKARRDILDNLNKVREELGLERFQVDLYSDLIADEYSQFLTRGEHNIEYFKSLQKDINIFGEVELVHTVSRFEEDVEINAEVFYQEFIDLGYLLLEVENDRKILLNPEYNHIGVGVATTQNGDRIILTQVFSKKMLAVTRINDGEDGGIEVRGKMLVSTHGVYAVRLQNLDTRKDVVVIGPPNIEFNPKGKEFTAVLDCDETIGSSNKIIELYVRSKWETIEYGKPSKEKINLKHVELVMRCPCIPYPDPKYLSEDEKDRIRLENERQMKARLEEEARIRKEQERQARKEDRKNRRKQIEELKARGEDVESLASSTQRSDRSFMSKASFLQGKKADDAAKNAQKQEAEDANDDKKSESKVEGDGEQEKSEDEGGMDIGKRQSVLSPEPIKDQEITNEKIMQELKQALAEALAQKEKLVSENEELQSKIYDLKKRKEGANALDRQTGSDVSGMNEHKYMNTLAHVHQIRIDLKQTQDRYNKMAAELQNKLDEKQKKCNEIKRAFIELKREVARKAAFSRTDKPIPDKMIEEWEVKEIAKNRELQALRLENLRLRNTLAKNQKILKKKEELAEGLHLIDFEQLKIENQTLNEKIEERNEDLHKLKKKNTTTVQILTHTKEKLQFETKTNEKLQAEGEELEKRLVELRENLNGRTTKPEKTGRKFARDSLRVQNQELRQKTLIFNSKSLKKDYELMEKRLKINADYLNYLKEKRAHMEGIIQEFNGSKTQKTNGGAIQTGYSMNGSQKLKYPMK